MICTGGMNQKLDGLGRKVVGWGSIPPVHMPKKNLGKAGPKMALRRYVYDNGVDIAVAVGVEVVTRTRSS